MIFEPVAVVDACPRRASPLREHSDPAVAAVVDGFVYDHPYLLPCAWGRTADAFSPRREAFGGTRQVARLPGPPYHFMSRIVEIHGPKDGMETGSRVVVNYDIPDNVWYREENCSPSMPLSVMMEIALQPCGWLASYIGSALTSKTHLCFRNLDGEGTVHAEILPGTRTLRTTAVITKIAQTADMIIEAFDVECAADGVPVFTLSTVFGFFPKPAFDNQLGLPASEAERAQRDQPALTAAVDLLSRPDRYCRGSLRLAAPMLLMLDRITGFWPQQGRAGLGRLRAEKDVDEGEWFFKTHFYGDPVQPGSLGMEAMAQLLQFYMLEKDMGAGIRNPRFQPVMTGGHLSWMHRGQVLPANRLITVELEILEAGRDADGPFAVAEAWLWVDDKRIHHAERIAMRILPGQESARTGSEILAVDNNVWLADHCPTWTAPVLPMMSIADRLAGAAAAHTGRRGCAALRNVQLRRWLLVSEPTSLTYEVTDGEEEDTYDVTMLVWRDAPDPELSRFEPVAEATVLFAPRIRDAPRPMVPLHDAEPAPDPYAEGALFHGPAFHYLTSLAIGTAGSSAVLDAGCGNVPHGFLHQGLLDAATHAIPHDQLWRWSADIPLGTVGHPHRIVTLEMFEPLPRTGDVQAEVRFAGFDKEDRDRPMFDIQLTHQGRIAVTMRLTDILLPQGPTGRVDRLQRRAFLQRRYAHGLGLSTTENGRTQLSVHDVDNSDWLPGTVAEVYGLPHQARGSDHLTEIAVRDHVARDLQVHPSELEVAQDARSAWLRGRPHTRRQVLAEISPDGTCHVTWDSQLPADTPVPRGRRPA